MAKESKTQKNHKKKRKPRYNAQFEFWTTKPGIVQVKVWCMHGATNPELCNLMHISNGTLHNWMNKSKEFMDAVHMSKSVADSQVVFSAYKSATGYKYQEDAMAGNGDVATLDKWQPANATIQKFWMLNRMPDDWKEKQQVELSGDVKIREKMAKMSTEQLERALEEGDGDQ